MMTLRFWSDFFWGLRRLRPRTPRRAWRFAWQCREDLRCVPVTWGEFWGVLFK